MAARFGLRHSGLAAPVLRLVIPALAGDGGADGFGAGAVFLAGVDPAGDPPAGLAGGGGLEFVEVGAGGIEGDEFAVVDAGRGRAADFEEEFAAEDAVGFAAAVGVFGIAEAEGVAQALAGVDGEWLTGRPEFFILGADSQA